MSPNPHLDGASFAPAKRILTGSATLAIMVVLHGSWLPFEFDTAGLREEGTGVLTRITWAATSIEDVITNLLIYLPVGLLLSLRLMLSGWSRCVRFAVTGILAGLTIFLAEGGQTVLPARHASFADMLCNVSGSIVGMWMAPAAWLLLIRIIQHFKLALADRPARVLFWIVATLVLFAKLAPYDVTVRPADLGRALSEARWSPFSPAVVPQADKLERLVEMAGSFFAFALLGILGAVSARDVGLSRIASTINTVARLILLAVLVELLQLPLASHRCDMADALTYVYGAAVGAILGSTVMYTRWQVGLVVLDNPGGRVLLMAALVLQIALLVGYAWPTHGGWISPSDRSIQWIPFYAQYQAPFARGVGQIISSLMWYVTLAVIAACVVARRSWHYRFVMAAFMTVGVVTLTEAVQAFSTTRAADMTEPVLAMVATVVATLACRWVENLRRSEIRV